MDERQGEGRLTGPPADGERPGSTAPRTVLVVDDEDQLLQLMTRVLERGGFRTLGASTGDEARELFREHASEISVVLCDVMMPDDDGAEVLVPEFLALSPHLQIILTSGDSLPEALEVLLGRIGGHFLHKPFVPKSLLRLIEPRDLTRSDPLGSSPSFAGPGGS